nr:ATP-binding protein [Methylomonas lenta]
MIVTSNLNVAVRIHMFCDTRMTMGLLDRITHHCNSWKQAKIPIDLNHEKRRWKTNNHTL